MGEAMDQEILYSTHDGVNDKSDKVAYRVPVPQLRSRKGQKNAFVAECRLFRNQNTCMYVLWWSVTTTGGFSRHTELAMPRQQRHVPL